MLIFPFETVKAIKLGKLCLVRVAFGMIIFRDAVAAKVAALEASPPGLSVRRLSFYRDSNVSIGNLAMATLTACTSVGRVFNAWHIVLFLESVLLVF